MKHPLVVIFLLLFTACGSHSNRSPQDRLLHYWDNFPYADSIVWTDTVRMRNTLLNWIQPLSQLPDGTAHRYARTVITAGHGKVAGQQALFGWLELLLNNPNSPYRNEELFIPILQAMTEDTLLSEIDKTRPRVLLSQALKNRKGTPAANIAFFTLDGKPHWLYDIHCEQILLYFFNPDCHDCQRVSDILINDPELNDRQREGRLQIIALYPDDDLTSWNKSIEGKNHEMRMGYPSSWMIARAPTLQEQERYNLPDVQEAYILPAIPSVYILDSTYIVLVKDAIIP